MTHEFTDIDRIAADQWMPVARGIAGVNDDISHLQTVPAQDCDDCTKDGRETDGIYQYGRLVLCKPCARARMRVARQQPLREAP